GVAGGRGHRGAGCAPARRFAAWRARRAGGASRRGNARRRRRTDDGANAVRRPCGTGRDYRTAPAGPRPRPPPGARLDGGAAPPGCAYHGAMLWRLDRGRLLRYAGLFTGAVIVLPLWLISRPVEDGEAASIGAGWPAWIAWAIFGFGFAWLSRALDSRRVNLADYVLLALMIGSAVALSYYSNSGLGVLLLMVAACVLPWLLPLPASIAVLVLSEIVVIPVYTRALGF